MTEDRPTPDMPAEPQTHQEVYEAYAASDNPSQHLLKEMDRLAQQEKIRTLDLVPPSYGLGSVALREQAASAPPEVGRKSEQTAAGEVLRETISQMRGLRARDEGHTQLSTDSHTTYFSLRRRAEELIKNGGYTAGELNDFTSEFAGLMLSNGTTWLQRVVPKAPATVLRDAYLAQQDGGAEQSPVNGVIEGMLDRSDLSQEVVRGMAKIYGLQDTLSLKSSEAGHKHDPNVQRIIAHAAFGVTAMDIDLDPTRFTPHERRRLEWLRPTYFRDWGERYLKHVVELPQDMRADLLFAAHGRTSQEDGTVDLAVFKEMLRTSETNVFGLDPKELRALHKRAGIVNLDYYKRDELRRMIQFVNGDPKLIKHLQAGDVTVVFTDAKGDHNGAFRNLGERYGTPSGRTLFFEVSKRTDFSRYRAMLGRFGVKASTIVLAAHGDPVRGMGYGGEDKGFYLSAQSPASRDLSIVDLELLPSILNNIMQDSRGIDDNGQAKGRRRIIFNSCSQDARSAWVKRKLPGGLEVIAGRESTAESLVRTVADPQLDVYAVDRPYGAWTMPHGIQALVPKDPNKGTFTKEESDPWYYNRLVMSRDGEMHVLKMATLPLRKGAPKVMPDSISVRPANAQRPLYDWEKSGL